MGFNWPRKDTSKNFHQAPIMHPTHAEAGEDVDKIATAMAQAYNAHDWDLYSSFLAASFVHQWPHRPGQPLFKEEFLSRTRELCDASPTYRIEVLDQTVTTPDSPEQSGGGTVLSVFQTCRQWGNKRRGDVVRDCFYILRFAQEHGTWLCQSMQAANGCHYFGVAT
ncbi:hypothetical protein M409DRAFT_29983 [Zasmidium cellare ATCC 36951]|uniref:SnoaL-like domain-containing protein n=1 Tax=Zasmidium cellare ATCC 36951 TaxID=1080233 RepID=A0A6A6C039_ZASCE|nr:uncharacterized protein M409DRAFT_29983 [Zasmidium cellare ATCC 36951]KAF2159510.1 hypothetical protein M409DRAFT_29983 [Zasmidium cellare ATCC 36951]